MPELFEPLVVECTREIVAEYGVERVLQLGGVEFLWNSICRTCPVPELLELLQHYETEAKQLIAGILGLV